MGHEAPERAAEGGPGRRPDVVEARPVSGPTTELATLDALAERAANTPVDRPPSPALRASSVQRLQLRAGNAAVAAMLQRRAAPTARKPAPALQRKPGAVGGGVAPLQRSTGAPATVAREGGAGAAGPATDAALAPAETLRSNGAGTGSSGAPAAPSAPGGPGGTGPPDVSTPGAPSAPAAPPPASPVQRRALDRPPAQGLPGATPIVQRSFASMLAEARKRAAKPTGPEDTKSVEGDTDLSDFTDKPDLANKERAAIPPPPPPPKPTIPPTLTGKVGEKPPPKPPKKKVGKALVAGPKGRKPKSGPGSMASAKPGEIVKKPAPPLPPKWKKPPPGKPVAEIPAAAAPVEKIGPKQDPAFNKVLKAAGMTVKKAKKHPTGKNEADSAQGAALPPSNDIDAQAKAERADTMATAKPKPFDEEMFVTAVKQELAKTAPKNLSEAGDVGKKAADAKGVIGDKVGASKEVAAGDVEKKSQEAPNPGDATPKPVTPMAPLEIEKPEGMKASGAMPAPVPSEAIDMREGPAKVDNEMGSAGVTEEQLAKSNEPEFTGALDAKKEGEKHSAEAPAEMRKAESAVLKQATASAAAVEKQTVSQANTSISDAVGKISGQKNETKSKDELKRKEVSDKINSIFDKTKSDVDGILKGLDDKVDAEFKSGEAEIRASFTADWKKRLGAYKDDRYSGLRGKYRWVRDKFKGLPAKANQLFEVSRKLYEDAMDKLVRRIATIVTQELTKATVRIEQGRGEVSAFVSTLKGDLAKFGQEAAEEVTEKFGNLDSAVKDKFDDMASSLAKKYADSRDAVNEEIAAEKEKNKGLIDKAIGAVQAVIRVIGQLKDMVLTILAKIADVIGRIIADPIGFLKRFLSAVGEGISRFANNIESHLKQGLMGWLFGALGATGIEIPKEFSIEGILKLVMSVLGFTWDFIKQRLIKKIGEPAVNALVEGADLVKKVVTGGPGVLWEMIVEKFNDFQSLVIDEIKNFVIEKVVKAGISWILGLLTPAGAFIKACQAIYSVVMFFVERGSEIKAFVEQVIDTAGAVARGESGGIPEKIEGVLAKLLPLAISFLAGLLGLGGVGDKVRSIIDKVQKPIGKAMDKVLDTVLAITAPVWKPIKAMYSRSKALAGKAKEKAIKAYETGKAKVKEVGGKVKDYAVHAKDKVKAKAGQMAGKVIYKGKEVYDRGKAVGQKAKEKVLALFKRQEKPLSMKGASHKLIAEPAGKGFKIKMASREDILSRKVKEAVESLKERMATEDGAAKRATQNQIDQLVEIGKIATALEQRSGVKPVDPKTGAPEGFAQEMAALAKRVEDYGAASGAKDITKADEGTVVDLRLLSKFGLPVASYLQAQAAADSLNATIDIRPTAVSAPQLYAKGAVPKGEEYKQKTVNDEDVALGIPKEYKNYLAWFRPVLPNEADYDAATFKKIEARAKERLDEYEKHKQDMTAQLELGTAYIIPAGGDETGGSGVVMKVLKGIGYTVTGDHDIYEVKGNTSAVFGALRKPPFNVQHEAHLDWPAAASDLKDEKLEDAKQIFANIVKKHLKGGESLLRINPKAPPTTANSRPITWDEAKSPSKGRVIRAAGPGGGKIGTGRVAATPEELNRLRAKLKDLKLVDELVAAAGTGAAAEALFEVVTVAQLKALLRARHDLPAAVAFIKAISAQRGDLDSILVLAPHFRKLSAPDGPQPAGLAAKGYARADIKHFLERHTPEYFGWEVKNDNTFFLPGTTPAKMGARVMDALNEGPLTPGTAASRTTSDGYPVRIKAATVNGNLEIVQFFPEPTNTRAINLKKLALTTLQTFLGA